MSKSYKKLIALFDLIVMFFTATAYQLAIQLPGVGKKMTRHSKSLGTSILLLSEFSVMVFISEQYLHLGIIVMAIIMAAFFMLEAVTRYFYNDQLTLLADEYFNYYNRYLFMFFAAFVAVCFAYLFYGLYNASKHQ